MNFPWLIFVDLGMMAGALLLATAIRARVPFFQRYLIPNALTAGFVLLAFYNLVGPWLSLTQQGLGALAYHLLNLSFIAMTLRQPEDQSTKARARAFPMAIGLLSQYGLQATVGLVLTFVFIFTTMPDLFPTFGFLVPLGFSSGPGQAYAIGEGWAQFGFVGAGSVGLTFAAIGFMWACFGGVYLINRGIRLGWIPRPQEDSSRNPGVRPAGDDLPIGSRLTTDSMAIDSMTYHVAMVLVTYLLTFLLLTGVTYLLSFAGKPGHDLAVSFWGIGFIFCTLVAMVVRRLLRLVGVSHTVETGSLTRISGLAIDLMVTAALGAISLIVVTEYWLPILVMSLVAGLLTFVLVPWMGSRMFPDHHFSRAVLIYGTAVGTLATGLALLRVLDPEFKSPVAGDYMSAAAMTFVLAIPLILMINLPAYGHMESNPIYYWISLGICLTYLVISAVAYRAVAGRRAFARPLQHWLPVTDTPAGEDNDGGGADSHRETDPC